MPVGGFANYRKSFGEDIAAALIELGRELFFGGAAGFFGQELDFPQMVAQGHADDLILFLFDIGLEMVGFFSKLIIGQAGAIGFQGVDFGDEIGVFLDVAFTGGAEQLGQCLADDFHDCHNVKSLENCLSRFVIMSFCG